MNQKHIAFVLFGAPCVCIFVGRGKDAKYKWTPFLRHAQDFRSTLGGWGMRSRPFRILGHLRLVGVRPKGNVEDNDACSSCLNRCYDSKRGHDGLVGSNNYNLRMYH